MLLCQRPKYKSMYINSFGDYIGMGETTAFKILSELFPNDGIQIQVPLTKLLTKEYEEYTSERQKKETIDIVIKREKRQPLCIRIQDKRHNSTRMSMIDKAQKKTLELSGCIVIDLWYYECPGLFMEDYESGKKEVLNFIREHI